jgi:hypothetical protein
MKPLFLFLVRSAILVAVLLGGLAEFARLQLWRLRGRGQRPGPTSAA